MKQQLLHHDDAVTDGQPLPAVLRSILSQNFCVCYICHSVRSCNSHAFRISATSWCFSALLVLCYVLAGLLGRGAGIPGQLPIRRKLQESCGHAASREARARRPLANWRGYRGARKEYVHFSIPVFPSLCPTFSDRILIYTMAATMMSVKSIRAPALRDAFRSATKPSPASRNGLRVLAQQFPPSGGSSPSSSATPDDILACTVSPLVLCCRAFSVQDSMCAGHTI